MPNTHFPNNLIQNITIILSKEFEDRPWGRYYVVHDDPAHKLKRIEVLP
jgi:hypothetical protein